MSSPNEIAVRGFVPESLGEALKLSERLAVSGLIPVALKGKPADVLVVLMTGRELGLAPMQALRSINVIQGKAAMSADLMQALVISRREVCEYFKLVESTPLVATYETLRKGNPSATRLSYSMEDAKAAGLATNDNYRKNPAAMLRARCKSSLCRAEYPDLLVGVYDPEELQPDKPAAFQPQAETAIEVKAEVVPEQAKEETPSQQLGLDEPPPVETGLVETVLQKPTRNGSRRFTIRLEGGKQFFTFDANIAQAAKDSMDAKQKLDIVYEMGQYGADIIELRPTSEAA